MFKNLLDTFRNGGRNIYRQTIGRIPTRFKFLMGPWVWIPATIGFAIFDANSDDSQPSVAQTIREEPLFALGGAVVAIATVVPAFLYYKRLVKR